MRIPSRKNKSKAEKRIRESKEHKEIKIDGKDYSYTQGNHGSGDNLEIWDTGTGQKQKQTKKTNKQYLQLDTGDKFKSKTKKIPPKIERQENVHWMQHRGTLPW